MSRRRRVLVAGASLAGVRTAETLRDRGFDGEIVLVGAEQQLPYDRPPLSKALLEGQGTADDVRLLTSDQVSALDLDLRLGRRALALDPVRRAVELDDGEALGYDQLVIATGSAPWMPRDWDLFEGIYPLRTVDDCLAIRSALQGSPRVAVVGGGPIGCEVASTARRLGCEVVQIEPLAAPMARVLGTEIALACAEIPLDAGVRLVCGTAVEGFDGGVRVERVRLRDGRMIEADVVVVGIGARPVTDWLFGSGVSVSDGVMCDDRCATSVAGVYAAGDVARWFNPLFEQTMRIEHWTNASEQGAFVARALLDGRQAGSYSPVPFVWSEQYGVKYEVAGVPHPTDRIRIVEGSVAERRFVAVYEREERLTGAFALNSTRSLLKFRRLLARDGAHAERVDVPSISS
ncbi:NAD(P)/FAD-dependent oxidoreductase [Streptomyces griseorubiginosus]|uniref:NAD(P)/FAD-dependent oxidoreductase n=1 Tax=Streptomyces griseorubiginosus TaxID=67304 RepID=UPI001AD7328E|nr:FAD-dependent oxidoreductase [Streptomyces griseorubiginosus]MBO4252302.1 FAD-dependent oxidoreductase [Streptomyces griseorubiginosus]